MTNSVPFENARTKRKCRDKMNMYGEPKKYFAHSQKVFQLANVA